MWSKRSTATTIALLLWIYAMGAIYVLGFRGASWWSILPPVGLAFLAGADLALPNLRREFWSWSPMLLLAIVTTSAKLQTVEPDLPLVMLVLVAATAGWGMRKLTSRRSGLGLPRRQ